MSNGAKQTPTGTVIDVRELPALLGIDAQTTSWTLWQRHARKETEIEDRNNVSRLNEYLRKQIIEYCVEYGFIGVDARTPRRDLVHPHLPMKGRPDLVINEASVFGAGTGIGLVEPVTGWEWTSEWCSATPRPTPPARVQCIAQGLFAISGCEWCVVVPVVGLDNVHAPIVIEYERDLTDQITLAVSQFSHSLDPRRPDPPPPDLAQRESFSAYRSLERASPRGSHEPRKLSAEEEQRYQPILQEVMEADRSIQSLQEQMAEIRKSTRTKRAELLAMASEGGEVQIGEHKVRVRTEQPRPRSPHEQWVVLSVD